MHFALLLGKLEAYSVLHTTYSWMRGYLFNSKNFNTLQEDALTNACLLENSKNFNTLQEDALRECGESGEDASVNANRILRNWGCNMDRRPQAGGPYCTPNFEE